MVVEQPAAFGRSTSGLAAGRYVLHDEIATGGMATVHLGRLLGAAGFARTVAIKRLHQSYAKDVDFIAMFLDEARLASRIRHPNVVPVLDVVADNTELLIVMEYVAGDSLAGLLRTCARTGSPMPPSIAVAVLADTLRGLHAAHEASNELGEPLGLVHRDVSPQNVLVSADGVACVADFGIAKAAGRVHTTRDGQLKGKLAYMAPEQLSDGAVDRRVDLYAAGVVLWEALTGRRLFKQDNPGSMVVEILDANVPPPSHFAPGLPAALDEVTAWALAKDPSARPATARAFGAALESALRSASRDELGAWVKLHAGEQIKARQGLIERMERAHADPTPRSQRRRELLAFTSAEPVTAAVGPAAQRAQVPSEEPTVGTSVLDGRRRERSRVWLAPAAATALVLGIGLGLRSGSAWAPFARPAAETPSSGPVKPPVNAATAALGPTPSATGNSSAAPSASSGPVRARTVTAAPKAKSSAPKATEDDVFGNIKWQ